MSRPDHRAEAAGQIAALPPWHQSRLDLLTDALRNPSMSPEERASLVWLAGWEKRTVENVAAVIRRAISLAELGGDRR